MLRSHNQRLEHVREVRLREQVSAVFEECVRLQLAHAELLLAGAMLRDELSILVALGCEASPESLAQLQVGNAKPDEGTDVSHSAANCPVDHVYADPEEAHGKGNEQKDHDTDNRGHGLVGRHGLECLAAEDRVFNGEHELCRCGKDAEDAHSNVAKRVPRVKQLAQSELHAKCGEVRRHQRAHQRKRENGVHGGRQAHVKRAGKHPRREREDVDIGAAP